MKKRFARIFVVNFILILIFSLSANAQHQLEKEKTEVQPLVFGQSIERQISKMEKHRFSLALEAKQFIKIEVAEKDCDVVISLRSPDGVNILEFKEADLNNGVKSVQAATSETGNYELRIISYGEIKSSGSYAVKFAETRPATEAEINFTAGVKLSNEVFGLINQSSSNIDEQRKKLQKGNQALEKFRLANAPRNEAAVMQHLSLVHFRLGELPQSVELSQAALEKFRSVSDRNGEAHVLSHLGDVYFTLGDTEKAIESFSVALKSFRETQKETIEATVLKKLGKVYESVKDYERAEIYYKQSADILMQFSNISLGDSLNNLGKIAFFKDEKEKALEFFQKALETVRREDHRFGTTKTDEAVFLNNIGRTFYELGRREKAVEAFNESLAISRENTSKSNEASSLRFLGKIYFELGENEKANGFFNQSLEIYRAVEDARNVAETILFLAKIDKQKNDLAAAQTKTELALKLIETIRGDVKNADLRDSFSANLQSFYEFYIEILMNRHAVEPNKNFAALAFEANERARARGLLNLLSESNANINEGVDAKLLRRETELENMLSAYLKHLTKILSEKSKADDAEKLKIEIEKIRAEYEQIQAKIRATSPRYATLTQPKTLGLKEIQTSVLDDDSVLLEYALGAEKSFLWIVSKNDFRLVELSDKEEIEKSARAFYESLTARNKQIKFETVAEREDRIFIADSDAQKYSKELSEKILAPAIPFLQNKRLLVVADGALQYVPFAALKNSKFEIQNSKSKNDDKFLIETNEIVSLPSASVLAVLRNETANRKMPSKTLAVLADPIFDKTDERFQTASGKNRTKNDYAKVSKSRTRGGEFSVTRDGLELPRLPFTRREAESISAVIPGNGSEKLLDFAASKTAAMSSSLADFQYIHFATHGFVNNENPELSGIVFSMIDANGKEQDGFLRIGDIYNLKLPAEMVVLSGCRTGLGKEIKGEGLVGLTRGFMYAGAKRVTVSLWDVNDEATSVLMANFYREMFGEKRLLPASGLRQAQISMIKSKDWNNPYFWSTFVLQGEPR